jgi:hypothetical protein
MNERTETGVRLTFFTLVDVTVLGTIAITRLWG